MYVMMMIMGIKPDLRGNPPIPLLSRGSDGPTRSLRHIVIIFLLLLLLIHYYYYYYYYYCTFASAARSCG